MSLHIVTTHMTQRTHQHRAHLESTLRGLLARARGQPTLDQQRAQGLRADPYAYVSPSAVLDRFFCWLITIEAEAVVAPHAHILAHDATTRRSLGYTKLGRVRIGRGAFVGARAIILPGVDVGDHAIVAAGSVVRRDVPSGTVVAGNPAVFVMNTDEYLNLQRQNMDGRPIYPKEGWTVQGGIDHERREQMRDSLADGPGWVQ